MSIHPAGPPEPCTYNLDAERSVLAAMLSDAASRATVSEQVEPDTYYLDAHRKAHSAILAIHARGEEPEPITLIDELAKAIDRGEAARIVGDISAYFCSPGALKSHLRVMRECYARRQAKRMGLELVERAGDRGVDMSAQLAEFGTRSAKLEASLNGNRMDELQSATLNGADFDAFEFPPPRSIIGNGLLWSMQLGFLYGDTGLGKSFLLEQLAHAVAAGERFMGMDTTEEPSPVLIVHMELGAFQVKERRQSRYPVTPRLLHTLTTDRLGRNLNLLDPAEVSSFARLAKSLDIQLTIFDPLQELHDEGEDNDAFHRVVRAVTTYMLTSGSAVVMGHHENKPPQDNRHNARSDVHTFRGGTRMPGAAKLMARLVQVPGGKFKLVWSKATNRKKPEPVFLEQSSSGWFDAVAAPEPIADRNQERVDRFLLAAGPDGIPMRDLLRLCSEAGGPRSERTIQAALDRIATKAGLPDGRAALQVGSNRGARYIHPSEWVQPVQGVQISELHRSSTNNGNDL